MRLPRITIEYDGTDEYEVVVVTPRAEVLWERHFGVPYISFTIPMTVHLEKTGNYREALAQLEADHVYYLAWCAKGCPTSRDVTADEPVGEADYLAWLDTIGNVQLGEPTPKIDAEVGESGPLGLTPEPGESLTSPSPPAAA